MSKAKPGKNKNKMFDADTKQFIPQTIEEYNKEISAALKNAQSGNVISIEELERESKHW